MRVRDGSAETAAARDDKDCGRASNQPRRRTASSTISLATPVLMPSSTRSSTGRSAHSGATTVGMTSSIGHTPLVGSGPDTFAP